MRKTSLLLAIALTGTLAPAATRAATPYTCAPANVPGGEWRTFSRDLDGRREQRQEHLLDVQRVASLEPKWTFDANWWTEGSNNEITSYPIIADGCVYVGSSTGRADGANLPGWVFSMNADTGKLVWQTKLDGNQPGELHYPVDDGRDNPCAFEVRGGGVFSTLHVEDGIVYAFVSQLNAPQVVAIDQATGEVLWTTVVDCQIGADAVSSPVVFTSTSGKKYVWVGVSGTAAEGDEADRLGFQGNYVLLEAGRDGGDIVRKEYTIPQDRWAEGYAGATVWSTLAIDTDPTSPVYLNGFVGTGNPFNYDFEEEHSNAVVRFDLRDTLPGNVANPAFGRITGSYKGDVEEYFPPVDDLPLCDEIDEIDNTFAAGFECVNLDLDFGATPNIWWTDSGRRLVGAGQKSGVYHAFDPVTMQPVWKTLLGHPSPVGGIVGSAAFDGERIYGPQTTVGYLWALDKDDGALQWITPVGDGVHWGNPVTLANRFLFTPDLKGFLNAYDTGTGAQVLARPLPLGTLREPTPTGKDPALTWGGASVARGAVYVTIGVGLASAGLASMPNGFVMMFEPARIPPELPGAPI